MAALSLPKGTPAELTARKAELALANQGAIEVPFRVMQVASEAFELLEAMAARGNPASASDAGVGALAARAAVRGAWLNVRINLPGLPDPASAAVMIKEGDRLVRAAEAAEERVLALVESKLK